MSNGELKSTDPGETRPGRNEIVIETVQYGLQPMILEKDVSVPIGDGTELFANVFRPMEDDKYPVLIAGDIYGKDSIHKIYAGEMPGGITLGGYPFIEVQDCAAGVAPRMSACG
ncbi:MAG: hypothetical protein QF393_01375 [Rhodospirillales bacterium]|jgi:predicted acyl esterase|nr:hypothetical protein [Rhodospirillales bacterium]MDP6643208.1 hypothetical protein [Rhodospirillales bacterium]